MRQTVRLNEVRSPSAPNDGLTPDVVLATDQASLTLDVHYNGVLTQIRNLLGTPTWRNLPSTNIASLAAFQTDAQATLQSQAQTQANIGQQVVNLAQMVNTLSGAAQTLAALQAEIAHIQQDLEQLGPTSAALSALASQVAALSTSVTQSTASINTQLATVASQMASDATRLATLESQAGDYVTNTGFINALSEAYVTNQPLSGPQDGTNLQFTAPTNFYVTSLQVSLNGQILRLGDTADYIVPGPVSGPTANTIRLNYQSAAPMAQDVLTATYLVAQTQE